jgi:hypothetical protein
LSGHAGDQRGFHGASRRLLRPRQRAVAWRTGKNGRATRFTDASIECEQVGSSERLGGEVRGRRSRFDLRAETKNHQIKPLKRNAAWRYEIE